MTLIKAGMAHSLSPNAWSKILRELHLREHDLRELTYLYAIQKEESKHNVAKAYPLFSKFEDESGYAGLAPHRSYITTLYIDFIEHACHVLDQCVAALPAGVIKWDHSFKVPKFMMKLNGTITFSSLFSLENEFSQLQYQSFVPTKSLSHVRTALEYISKSLEDHGLPQPNLGFTDNVASDYATFAEIFPLLSEGVKAVHLDEFSDLPRRTLPSHIIVPICTTEIEIQTACDSILELALETDGGIIYIGFDMETVGVPLQVAGPVWQLVSLVMWRKEVAHGVIIPQPHEFSISVGNATTSLQVSSTKR
jgi:hypothetical protein